MKVSNVLKLLSVMFMVGISGVQGAIDMMHMETEIHSSRVEGNRVPFLTVRISEVNVIL